LVENLRIDVGQILWSEHYGTRNYNGEGPEVMEHKVILQLQGAYDLII